MAKKRTTPELNLQAELPKVLSTDFNLFYKPEAKPIDPTVEIFTKSLDRFVAGAGTDLVIQKEEKVKKENEAQAIKDYNENKAKFSKQVELGNIPKEANPYYIQKLQELDLNSKAQKFKSIVSQKYVEMNVLENPDPNAFDKFYNDELTKFVQENNLGLFSPEKLEQGFFTKTSGTRNSLFNTHVQSQMGKIKEDYKILFKEGVQGFFDPNKSMSEIGDGIELFIKDKTANGLGNLTAREYFIEALTDYATNTGDLEFAEKLLRELPKNVQLGTDTLDKNLSIKDDLDVIREKIDDRIQQEENELITKKKNKREIEDLEADDYADEFETLTEAEKDPRFKTFSRYKQDKVRDAYNKRDVGFGSETKPYVEEEFRKKLKDNDFEGALEYLKNNIPNMTSNYYYKAKDTVKAYKFTGKDGLLASDEFVYYKADLEDIAKRGNKSSKIATYDELVGEKLELKARKWLKDNEVEDYAKPIDRETAFEEFISKEYSKAKSKLLTQGGVTIEGETAQSGEVTIDGEGSDETPIIVNENQLIKPEEKKKSKKELRNPVIEDPELKIDLSEVVIIPENLTGTRLRKFKRDNPEAITQEEYDRIAEKQEKNNKQLVAEVGSE